MIPEVVARKQLLAANGIFTLTLNAAFALGFALLGPLVVNIASPEAVILVVAFLYLLAAVFCFTLPKSPPPPREDVRGLGVSEAEHAVGSTFAQLREGLAFIRSNRSISWSLLYLGITASLVGVLGVLGPDFAQETLGLGAKDFAVVVLPLGFGIVTGILLLNAYGRYLPRRRVIEGGLIALGAAAGPARRRGTDQPAAAAGGRPGRPRPVGGHLAAGGRGRDRARSPGIAYGFVAIPAQTQLQEDLPEDVRGRVFGVLNMLVSVASFVPIIIVGPISDAFGTTAVIITVALSIFVVGVAVRRETGAVDRDSEASPAADPHIVDPIASALGADLPTWHEPRRCRRSATWRRPGPRPTAAATRPAPADARCAPAAERRRTPGPADPADRD